MKKEAEVKSTLENSEARLDQVRTALSEDERVQRVLGEQVGSYEKDIVRLKQKQKKQRHV